MNHLHSAVRAERPSVALIVALSGVAALLTSLLLFTLLA